MNKEKERKDWERMYKEMTNPETILETKRIADKNKRKEDKMLDTGL